MRASGPYEVKPRQLRALVLLLMLLPLIPTAFVVRFMLESIYSERVEARERVRPVYQKFLEKAGSILAANAERQAQAETDSGAASPRALVYSGMADAVLIAAPGGRLLLPPPEPPLPASAAADAKYDPNLAAASDALARSVLDSGARLTAMSNRGATRWRFLCETPEPLFAMNSHLAAGSGSEAGTTLLFLRTRAHLLETISAFYQRTLDPQSVLVLLDENGESVPLVGPPGAAAGEPLAESALKPPLPLWRVQLYGASASLLDAFTREQVVFYFWTIGGILAATAAIAGLAGLTLSRRIVLHELSNDALAVVAHEMKTPLTSVRMFVDTLLERRYCGGPDQADEYLRLIAQENERLERLVEGFLTLSRLERNHGRALALASTRAQEVVESAHGRLRLRLESDGCRFDAQVEPDLPPFPADAEALTAVLVNLLDNAFKYSGDDKRIGLRVFGRESDVVFEVSDNGQGIARDEQDKIFQRFYQSDRRLARSHDGCGLGLSIVQSIMRAHGGGVSVESEPGQGSVFAVRLPKAERPKAEG